MASPQFIELLEEMRQIGDQKLLRWEPIKRTRYSSRCDFCIALGAGVIHVTGSDDDESQWRASYKAYLMTRDGLMVDEIEGSQYESECYPLLRDLFQQARVAAFNLPRMIEEMQSDLVAGRTRELPKDLIQPEAEVDDSEIPF
jgi:hypothetical protein